MILFVTELGSLKRVPAEGGASTDVIKAEPRAIRASRPVFLPDGVHFLYGKTTNSPSGGGLFVASLDDLTGRRLLTDFSSLEFVPDSPTSSAGHLLFVREGNLMAQSFDATTLQLSGEPFAVAGQVGFTSLRPQMAASASAVGTIAFLANGNPVRQLIWYDRSGEESGRAALTGSLGTAVSLAPDGRSVAFIRSDGQAPAESRQLDFERNQESRLLPSASIVVWSPDFRRVAFPDAVDGTPGLYARPASGGAPELLLRGGDNRQRPSDGAGFTNRVALVATAVMFAASSAISADRLPHRAITRWNGRIRMRLAQILDLFLVANMGGECAQQATRGSARARSPDTCDKRMKCAHHCAHHPETP